LLVLIDMPVLQKRLAHHAQLCTQRYVLAANAIAACRSPPRTSAASMRVSAAAWVMEPHPASWPAGRRPRASSIVTRTKRSAAFRIEESGDPATDRGPRRHSARERYSPIAKMSIATALPAHLDAAAIEARLFKRTDQGVRSNTG
jgi:hypothetical protein